jgi:imidazolonepropionase-like amidohydrolase
MVMKPASEKTITVHTDCLFDPKRKTFVKDTSIVVSPESGLITKVYQRTDKLPGDIKDPDIDLRGKCVLPGLVDSHTHILLHAYSETSSTNQFMNESLVERVIRATNHCRTALLAGYTTYRDLGTEGAYDADVHIRDAVNRGIIPGPRIYCVTECLASSGGYENRVENRIGGLEPPRISDPCDGPVGCRAGVRRRLGAGADLIKFYADYRKRALRFPQSAWKGCPEIMFPPPNDVLGGERNPNFLLFNQEEMDAIVAEAKTARAPVAAHASTAEGVTMAAKAGVTTIEHGFEPMDGSAAMQTMHDNGTIFVPTLAVVELYINVKPVLKQVKKAYDSGIKLAAGGDTGAFAHGENVRELELMLEAGIPLEEVLVAATLHGWEACGGEWCGRKFGWIEEGCAADLVALEADVREDVKALRNVGFVMKDGTVWKRDGNAVGMA